MTETPPTDQPVKRGRGRPATGVTPKRNVRIGDVWDDLEPHAKATDGSMTALVTRLLEEEAARLREAGKL